MENNQFVKEQNEQALASGSNDKEIFIHMFNDECRTSPLIIEKIDDLNEYINDLIFKSHKSLQGGIEVERNDNEIVTIKRVELKFE